MTEEQAKQIKGMKLPLTPELGMFFEQLKADQALIDGLTGQIRSVQELPKKWRDNPDQSVEQCARDIEDLLIAKDA